MAIVGRAGDVLDTMQDTISLPCLADGLGRVVSVRGSQACVGLTAPSPQYPHDARATVGRFLGVRAGPSLLVGLITEISLQYSAPREKEQTALARVDLIGEIRSYDTTAARFLRGVSTYPAIGDPVTFVSSRELRLIFDVTSTGSIEIGKLQQDAEIAAFVNVHELLSKHFAVLGTTGVGKSSAVALLLQQVLNIHRSLRVLVLDVHNEYGRCFPGSAQLLNPGNIRLPFWLFNFEEIVDIFFACIMRILRGWDSEPDTSLRALHRNHATKPTGRTRKGIHIPYGIQDIPRRPTLAIHPSARQRDDVAAMRVSRMERGPRYNRVS